MWLAVTVQQKKKRRSVVRRSHGAWGQGLWLGAAPGGAFSSAAFRVWPVT